MGAGFHGGFGNGTKGAVIEKAYRMSTMTHSASQPRLNSSSLVGIGAATTSGMECGRLDDGALQENTLVLTLVEKQGYPTGSLGIIVDIFAELKSCNVQLLDNQYHPQDIVNYLFSEIEIIT